MVVKPIKSEHKKILDKIRDLWIQSGGKPFGDPETWGLNERGKSIDGIEIHFDYGVPYRMFTPDGYYIVLGCSLVGDTNKFWGLFVQEFDTEIVVPKREDSKMSLGECDCSYSGPLVRIEQRQNLGVVKNDKITG